ncbi:MAG: aspartate dehydrogenase [Lachnospiraceae bacterium]|nr:aspartate dehydrogenase [Lachnospiraceae bacterium]
MFGRKRTPEKNQQHSQTKKEYDPSVYKPVLKCSICNGEQVAGFKNRETGKFEEIQFIRNEQELAQFLKNYGLDTIEKEY